MLSLVGYEAVRAHADREVGEQLASVFHAANVKRPNRDI
jgi:hypothetical protein